jgi:hypothetical protein
VFRYAAKCWISLHLARVKSTGQVWGLEDGLFAAAWVCQHYLRALVDANINEQCLDLAHMACFYKSYNAGFGRHLYFLTLPQFSDVLKWQVAPQDLSKSPN